VKRHLYGTAAALIVIASGGLASACDVTPPAATANGATISTASLNTQLQALETTSAGGCLLQLENGQLTSALAAGEGGHGTFSTPFAGFVLGNRVGDLLAGEFAASKGITITSAQLASAKSDLQSTLDGEISQSLQAAEQSGAVPACADLTTGAAITGVQLLRGLPASLAAEQVKNQAVDEKLLARGADLSNAAVVKYYDANTPLFTQTCLSRIVTATQADATTALAKLQAGSSFADVAKASSIDAQTAANGGAIGCNITAAQVEQELGVQSLTVGQPIPPVSNGTQWVIYEVTSQTLVPLAESEGVVRQELLQTQANVARVGKEIVAFAHRSDVSVDPQYGTWKDQGVVPPVGPPSQYLLAAVSGQPAAPSTLKGAGSGSTPTTSTPTTVPTAPSGATGGTGSTGSAGG
jgi:parvulin-like peptidyl-prolyl isomerase